jgi:hypothetical protein
LKYVSTAKARCSADQRSIATEMLWISLEERSRTNFPSQRFHSQLCYQIVRYFCRTLYLTSEEVKYICRDNEYKPLRFKILTFKNPASYI